MLTSRCLPPGNQWRLFVLDVLLLAVYLAATMRPGPVLAAERRPGTVHLHDRATPLTFGVRSKRARVHPELAAIVADPDAQLVPFLQRMAPAPLGPLGLPQPVTTLSNPSARVSKYRVVFGERPAVECTVELAHAGTSISVHWARRDDAGGDLPGI